MEETREDRRARVKAQAQARNTAYQKWLERGGNSIADAWVSVGPNSQTHDVRSYPLVEVVELIRTGDSIRVETKWGTKWVSLAENQEKVRALYQIGVDEAKSLNRLRIGRVLQTLGIDAKPDEVEPILEQPKENVKLFYVTGLRLGDETIPVTEPSVVYHRPGDLGKARADNAKKWTPAVTLAGLFLPYRDRQYLVRSTGLFPLDIDGFSDPQVLADKRAEIAEDEHVALLFNSISGSGLRACVLGPETTNASQYERAYRLIARDKAAKWGIEAQVDDQTCDVSRLCFLPYDKEILYRP